VKSAGSSAAADDVLGPSAMWGCVCRVGGCWGWGRWLSQRLDGAGLTHTQLAGNW
jgi:hypothetical protein